MKYDIDGRTGVRPPPSRVYDATGVLIPGVLRCDTETGEVVRVSVGENFLPVRRNGRFAEVTETRPAPLRVVPVTPPAPNAPHGSVGQPDLN